MHHLATRLAFRPARPCFATNLLESQQVLYRYGLFVVDSEVCITITKHVNKYLDLRLLLNSEYSFIADLIRLLLASDTVTDSRTLQHIQRCKEMTLPADYCNRYLRHAERK